MDYFISSLPCVLDIDIDIDTDRYKYTYTYSYRWHIGHIGIDTDIEPSNILEDTKFPLS